MTRCEFRFFVLFSVLLSASVSGHAYIKHWKSSLDDRLQPAQKVYSLAKTAYRPVSDNIGWIGSKFLTANQAIVCGASYTPKGTVAPAGGRFFSDSSEAAGKTLAVNAGGKITLVVAGDATTAKGYPHLQGHIQTYLGYCGPSPTACQSFNAAKAYYFKIQEEKEGVRKLRQQLSYSLGGDVWAVPIPREVPQGSYIFRFEIITYGESVSSEGFQDQYYPSCGQIYVNSNKQITPSSFAKLPLLRLPGGYQNGNLFRAASSVPGPAVVSGDFALSGSQKLHRSIHRATRSPSSPSHRSSTSLPASNRTVSIPKPSQTSARICLPKSVPHCAKSCLKKKLEEVDLLAPSCPDFEALCLCKTDSFFKAFENCLKDHCLNEKEECTASTAFKKACHIKSK